MKYYCISYRTQTIQRSVQIIEENVHKAIECLFKDTPNAVILNIFSEEILEEE